VARAQTRVFFPWERKRGVLGLVGRARARLVLWTLLGVALVVVVQTRERREADLRATRASIGVAERAVAAYRADHGGACPKELRELVGGGYARDVPEDAWGRPLRLSCPGRRDPAGFDLESDGPDGLPGGLDRVQ